MVAIYTTPPHIWFIFSITIWMKHQELCFSTLQLMIRYRKPGRSIITLMPGLPAVMRTWRSLLVQLKSQVFRMKTQAKIRLMIRLTTQMILVMITRMTQLMITRMTQLMTTQMIHLTITQMIHPTTRTTIRIIRIIIATIIRTTAITTLAAREALVPREGIGLRI